MTLLALDASTAWLSVAATDGRTTVALDEHLGARAGARILGAIDDCLDGCGLTRARIQGIVVGFGPGAFTGVRLAVGVAQGLAYGLRVPLFGVSGLMALAEEARVTLGCRRVVVANDARMGELYWAAYACDDPMGAAARWHAQAEPALGAPAQLDASAWPDDWAVSGNALLPDGGFDTLRQAWAHRPLHPASHPRARYLLNLARAGAAGPAHHDAAMVQPLYVRDKVALTSAERAARAAAVSP